MKYVWLGAGAVLLLWLLAVLLLMTGVMALWVFWKISIAAIMILGPIAVYYIVTECL